MLGQASFLAWAGPGQLWQGQAGLGQVRPAQASLGWPKQDTFLHGPGLFIMLYKVVLTFESVEKNP